MVLENDMSSREKLINAATSSLKYSYSKYSKLRVAAAILTKEGNIITGCNIENRSLGLSICAERVALFKAVSEGCRAIKSIGITSSLQEPVYPCGACRQVLSEFEPNLVIYVNHDRRSYKLSKIHPLNFDNKF